MVDWKKAYLRRILGNANQVISVSRKLADTLQSSYSIEDVKIIPNYIDTDHFDYKPRKSAGFSYLFVGGLEVHKGIDLLVEAFCEAKIPVARLHIVGTGDMKEKINAIVSEHQMEGNVVLYGEIPNRDLPDIYNSCHVYVSVSEYETFGVSVLEAMSCGLPVLYTPSGGPNETVSEESGVLLHGREKEDIIEGLKEIKNRYHSFDGKKIRDAVIKNFGSEKVIRSLMDVYKAVLNE